MKPYVFNCYIKYYNSIFLLTVRGRGYIQCSPRFALNGVLISKIKFFKKCENKDKHSSLFSS